MSESNLKVWLFGSIDPYNNGDSALSDFLQTCNSVEEARKIAHEKLNSDEIRWVEMVYVEDNAPTTILVWNSQKNKWVLASSNVHI